MWAGELRKLGYPVIYFDAFEHDYVEDAFAAVAGEIIFLLKRAKKASSSAGKQFLQKAAAAGKIVAKAGIRIGAKAATLGALDGTELKGIADDVADAVANISDDYIGELLVRRERERDAITSFRQALSDLPKILTPKGDAKPLIFILDELDRCRPPFALDLLERIKHFFSVGNIHFVLGVHSGQLRSSISLTYGSNVDAARYLQKFINLSFYLYDKADSERERTARKFVGHLQQALEFDPKDRDLVDTIRTVLGDVAVMRDMSLREIERVMTTIAIAIAYTPENYFRPAVIIAGLAILKVVEPDLYLKAKRGTLSFDEVRIALALGESFNDIQGNGARARIADWWRYCTEGRASEEFSRIAQDMSFRYNIDRDEAHLLASKIANDVIDRFVTR